MQVNIENKSIKKSVVLEGNYFKVYGYCKNKKLLPELYITVKKEKSEDKVATVSLYNNEVQLVDHNFKSVYCLDAYNMLMISEWIHTVEFCHNAIIDLLGEVSYDI